MASPSKNKPLRASAWRRLRGLLLRSTFSDCSHGFGALGLPSGSVVATVMTSRGAVRPTLGSAQPTKLGVGKAADMQQSMQQRRATRAKRSQVEQSRLRVLAQMAAFLDKGSHDYSPDTNPSWDYFTSLRAGSAPSARRVRASAGRQATSTRTSCSRSARRAAAVRISTSSCATERALSSSLRL